MEKFIQKIFTRDILDRSLLAFGLEKQTSEDMEGFENFVYRVIRNDQRYILRIAHSSHRSVEEILAELKFINLLKNAGVNVAASVKLNNGLYIERIPAKQGEFCSSLFEYAEGRLTNAQDRNNPEFLKEWGRLIGQIHSSSFQMERDGIKLKRSSFVQDMRKWLKYMQLLAPQQQKDLIRLLDQIDSFQHKDYYGLVHADAHMGNFHLHKNKITLFDFDDCCYTSYANDLAIVWYYALPKDGFGYASEARCRLFLESFLEGYYSEFFLPPEHLAETPANLQFRDLFLCMLVQATLDVSDDDDLKKFFEAVSYRTSHSDCYIQGDLVLETAASALKNKGGN